MSTVNVLPSLPAVSLEELVQLSESLVGDITELQVDIVDGMFVPAVSWPFVEANPMSAFNELLVLPSELKLEIDCMVERPEQYFEALVNLPVTRVVIHFGSTEKYSELLEIGKTRGYQMGLGITNDDFERGDFQSLMEQFSYVQVMGIKEVGKQGQPFDERTLVTVASLRKQYPDLEIAVDGSVNLSTIKSLVEAGANRLAPGSAVSKADNPREALQQLRALANS